MSLKEQYRKEIVPELMKKMGYSTVMEVPRIEKVTLNMGVGEAVADKKVMGFAVKDLAKIAGQQPIITKARKSISSFKIRDDYPIGCKVTLRRQKMFDFLERLIMVSLPRIRDFRGLNPKSFDGHGNYNLGVREQIIFPEIEYDKIDTLRGLNITITTTAKSDDEARELLKLMHFPFKRDNMAKKSLRYREVKRERLAKRYASKRAAIFAVLEDSNATPEEKFAARLEFQKIPRNAMPVRQRRRCALTGRPRGTFRKFGLGRNKIREIAMSGGIPGVIKSSW